mmetsp:Transcript_13015/g.19622  ORF Transcript_13015/g.19622 Transcript_13015/m.19622 type:complete len:282 (+) Transcript_13015:3-848(+)
MKEVEQFDDYHALEVMKLAAKKAGVVIREAFKLPVSARVDTKSASTDLVTETDKEAEGVIIRLIKKHYPKAAFIAEESDSGKGKEAFDKKDGTLIFVIDPIDGTTNFVHRYPEIAVSIGLVINQLPVVAVCYNPILEDMYTAVQGHGAYKNGLPIRVSTITTLDKSIIASNMPYDRSDASIDRVEKIYRKCLKKGIHGVRQPGSAVLCCCYVAEGRLEVYAEKGIQIWDVVAGALIIQEAGGVICNPHTGGPVDWMNHLFCGANNDPIMREMVAIHKEALI